MSWYSDRTRTLGPHGSSSRDKNFDLDLDSRVSRPPVTDRLRMLEMESFLKRERVRIEENAREMELKQKAMFMRQKEAVMLEREKLKRMEEEMERMQTMRLRPSSDGPFTKNKMVDRYNDGYRSSLNTGRPSGDQFRQMSSYNSGKTFENERKFHASPPRSNVIRDHGYRDVSDGRERKSAFQRSVPNSWPGSDGLRDDVRKRELDLEMRTSRLPEKRGFPDDSYGFSSNSEMSKRPKLQNSWSSPRRMNFRDGYLEQDDSRGSFGSLPEERVKPGFFKAIQNPMLKSPPKDNTSSFFQRDALLNSQSTKSPSRSNRRMGSRGGFGGTIRLDKGLPVNRSRGWNATSVPPVKAALTPQLLRNIELEARKLIQDEWNPQQRKVYEGTSNIGFKRNDRSMTGPSIKFQNFKGKKFVQVKRLDSAQEATRNVGFKRKGPSKTGPAKTGPVAKLQNSKGNKLDSVQEATRNVGFKGKNRPNTGPNQNSKAKKDVKLLDSAQGKPPKKKKKKKAADKSGIGSKPSESTSAKKDYIQVLATDKPTGEEWTKPYFCIYCKAQYKDRGVYRTHLGSVKHKGVVKAREKVLNDLRKVDKMSTSKKYKLGVSCHLCHESFSRRYILNRHMASLQHSRNLACSLRTKGKYVDSAEQLKCPDTFDGTAVGPDFIKDVKCAQCHVCGETPLLKGDAINHAKSKEHHEAFTKYKEKVLAEQKLNKKLPAKSNDKKKPKAKKKAKKGKVQPEQKVTEEVAAKGKSIAPIELPGTVEKESETAQKEAVTIKEEKIKGATPTTATRKQEKSDSVEVTNEATETAKQPSAAMEY